MMIKYRAEQQCSLRTFPEYIELLLFSFSAVQ